MNFGEKWLEAREAGRLVRMDSLRVGAKFRACGDDEYTLARRDGALSGVYHARRLSDSFDECFAGCADVEVIQ